MNLPTIHFSIPSTQIQLRDPIKYYIFVEQINDHQLLIHIKKVIVGIHYLIKCY